MPVDSEEKRRGAIAEGQPGVAPIKPDGAVEDEDRAILSGVYIGSLFDSGLGALGGLSKNMFGDGMCYTFKR